MDTDVQQQVSTLLQAENQSLQKLLSILEEENQSLNTKNYAELEEISSRKQQMIARLEQHSRNRMVFIEQLGINPKGSGWTEKLADFGNGSDSVKEPLERIQDLTRQCRSLNRTNGMVLNQRKHLATQLMGILRDDNKSETYSCGGVTEPSNEHRILGKA